MSVSPLHLVPELQGVCVVGFDVVLDEHRFALGNCGSITSGGLWRLLIDGAIAGTELDYGKADWRTNGTSMSTQIEDLLKSRLLGNPIVSVGVRVPTGDLIIDFPNGVVLEFIKLHSFLESWEVKAPGMYLLVDAWGRVNKWG